MDGEALMMPHENTLYDVIAKLRRDVELLKASNADILKQLEDLRHLSVEDYDRTKRW